MIFNKVIPFHEILIDDDNIIIRIDESIQDLLKEKSEADLKDIDSQLLEGFECIQFSSDNKKIFDYKVIIKHCLNNLLTLKLF